VGRTRPHWVYWWWLLLWILCVEYLLIILYCLLIWCCWVGTDFGDVVAGCHGKTVWWWRVVEGIAEREEQVAGGSRAQPGKKASEDGERWRQLVVDWWQQTEHEWRRGCGWIGFFGLRLQRKERMRRSRRKKFDDIKDMTSNLFWFWEISVGILWGICNSNFFVFLFGFSSGYLWLWYQMMWNKMQVCVCVCVKSVIKPTYNVSL